MATNIEQATTPPYWASNADDIEFTFNFKNELINGIGSNGGKAQVTMFGTFIVTPTAGDYVYINSPLYNGIYKILTIDSSIIITLDTPYLGGITLDTYNLKYLRIPTFDLFKGFKTGETFPIDLPYTKVTSIKPNYIINTSTGAPYIKINIKGIAKHLFTITPNFTVNQPDFSVFNAIRLFWDNTTTLFSSLHDFTLVLNSGLTNEQLLNYTTHGYYLTPIDKPIVMSNGTSFATFFYYGGNQENFPVVHKFINGVLQ